MRHVTIYRGPGRYAGWPANYGIWSWGDEIVVGFTVGTHGTGGGFHAIDRSRPFVGMQGRSLDGGESWQVERTPCRTPGNRGLSADEHMEEGIRVGEVLDGENAPVDCPGGVDFTDPDFALMCAKTGLGPGVTSFFYTSTDRCRSWQGPFRIPMYGQSGIAARTDYLVSGPHECTLFLTANKRDGAEGRVFCATTANGGRTLDFASWIGPEPDGFSIMPASVRLSGARIVVAVRRREAGPGGRALDDWIDAYASGDHGATWQLLSRPVAATGRGGNPPALIRLRDGRLCLTYGYRDAPYQIRATLSEDEGRSWGEPIVLRSGAGCHDLGYPRTAQRPDGVVVTAYYFNDAPETERYIAATLWSP